MIENKMFPAVRWSVLVLAIVCVAFAGWVSALLLRDPDTVTPVARPIGWLAIAVMLALSGLCGVLFAQGVRRRAHSQYGMMIGGLGGGALGAMLILASAEPAGFVVLGVVAVATILHFLEEHQLATRQKLLEIEYRLAELQEKMGDR